MRLPTAVAVSAAALAVALTATPAAYADDVRPSGLAGVSGVGIHNTYNDKTDYTYLADALDSGTSLIELDTWANVLNGKWDVSHGNPLASDNSCVQAGSAADLYTGNRNQNLDSCRACPRRRSASPVVQLSAFQRAGTFGGSQPGSDVCPWMHW